MKPGIDLQIAHFFRGKPQLNAAIGANKGDLRKACGILDTQPEQPFRKRPQANFASLLVHCMRFVWKRYLTFYRINSPLTAVSGQTTMNFDAMTLFCYLPSDTRTAKAERS
jgi:hypothetical protein